jgi:hypothetical protein
MGAYLRGRVYHYKRMIDGRTYYRSLKIHKGQEPLLSGRIKQVDDEITVLHFGLVPPARGTILFSEYVKKYLDRKGRNASVYHVRRRLKIIKELWPDLPLNQYAPAHIRALEKELFARKLAPATVNRYMEHLRNLWNCAIEDREAIENPVRTYDLFAEDGARRALKIVSILKRARSRLLCWIQKTSASSRRPGRRTARSFFPDDSAET